MESTDAEVTVTPPSQLAGARSRPPRFMAGREVEIRQLYRQVLDEPVPSRLLDILRAALAPRS
jgi:hypothetical protein